MGYCVEKFGGDMNTDKLGRWILRNGMIAVSHINPSASEGNRVERYLGHPMIAPDCMTVKICWNENGECVWMQGIVDNTQNYDLMERLDGKDRVEARMKVEGCLICNPLEDK